MFLRIDDFKKEWLWDFGKGYGPLGWAQKPAQDTLKEYLDNPSFNRKQTPYFFFSKERIKEGTWWYECKTDEDIVKRINYLIELYEDLKKNGIRQAICLNIKEKGKMRVEDGYHRLFCLDLLDYLRKIPVQILSIAPDFLDLICKLTKLGNGKPVSYQPLGNEDSALFHPYFREWRCWRPDTENRLLSLYPFLTDCKTIVDIGACEGYFSINLAAKGFDVISIEVNNERASIINYFTNLRGLKNLEIEKVDWRDFAWDRRFDAVIFLSTFHHQIISNGLEQFKELNKIKAKKLFLEMATVKEAKMKGFPNLSEEKMIKLVLDNTKFSEAKLIFENPLFTRNIYLFR